jgi:hypothetical protein
MVMLLSLIDTFKRQTAMAQECDNQSTPGVSNITTGTGDFVGTSKPVPPSLNLLPQDYEPEKLVPNPEAFELAKNESISETPPDWLIASLENKNAIEPPIIPSPK